MIGDYRCEKCGLTAVNVLLPVHHNCQPQPMRGLGDLIAVTIKKVTRGKVKPCAGCNKRIDKANAWLPFKAE